MNEREQIIADCQKIAGCDVNLGVDQLQCVPNSLLPMMIAGSLQVSAIGLMTTKTTIKGSIDELSRIYRLIDDQENVCIIAAKAIERKYGLTQGQDGSGEDGPDVEVEASEGREEEPGPVDLG